jgi:hypothetical protein
VALRGPAAPDEPFRQSAYRVTVVLPLSGAEFRARETSLRRIVRENVPAHVAYRLRLGGTAPLGSGRRMDGELRLDGHPAIRLGMRGPLGSAVLRGEGGIGARLGSGSVVGLGFRLT